MLYSAVATSILFIIFIALVAVDGGKATQWASVVMLFLITPVMTYGWQATKFLYSSEIAPLEYRHIGAAFFSSGEWLMVFITVFASPIGLENCGWSFWFFILAGNLVAVVFVWLLCPETAGKTLEEGESNISEVSDLQRANSKQLIICLLVMVSPDCARVRSRMLLRSRSWQLLMLRFWRRVARTSPSQIVSHSCISICCLVDWVWSSLGVELRYLSAAYSMNLAISMP